MRQRRRRFAARRAPVEHGRGDREHEEERLEAEATSALTLRLRGAPRAPAAPARPQQQRDAYPEREELLDRHHDPRQSAGRASAEIPYAPWYHG